MTYRVFVNVNRGIMDSTSVCVFPWEVPLLEEIHGESTQLTTPEAMAEIKGASAVKPLKFPYNPEADPLMPLKDALIKQLMVASEDDPFHDLGGEYDRLVNLYGMDKELPMPVVKKVYGSPQQFAQAVRQYRKGSLPPANIDALIHGMADDSPDEELEDDLEDMAPADMTVVQLRKRLRDMGVKVPERATKDALVDLVVDQMAEA